MERWGEKGIEGVGLDARASFTATRDFTQSQY